MSQLFLTYFVSPAAALLGVAAMVYLGWLVPVKSHNRELHSKQLQIDALEAAVKEHQMRADDATRQLIHILSAVNVAKTAVGSTTETT
jgi:hypothetical protein